MTDTKRDRERSGRGKERQHRLRGADPTGFETPVVASSSVSPDEGPIRLE